MLQAFALENGGEVLVELEDMGPRPLADGLGDQAVESFESVFQKLRPVIDEIVRGLGDLDLEEVSVSFSIKLTAERQILFLAKGGIEGGIELSLTWKPQSAGAQEPN